MAQAWTDRALHNACQKAGSTEQDEAFEYLYRQLYPIAYFMISSTHHPDPVDMAADCAQEAVIKVWDNLSTCRDPDGFLGWAKRITRNHTLNEIAKTRRLVFYPDIPPEPDNGQDPPPDVVIKKELHKTLVDFLSKAPLSDRSKQVVLGRFLEDKRDIELAEELSRSEGRDVRPSHIQVTRSKDLKRLQLDERLKARLKARL